MSENFTNKSIGSYTIPPVYFAGIRFSGSETDDGLPISLNSKLYDYDHTDMDYGSYEWLSNPARMSGRAFVPTTGLGHYQFFLGNYSDGYPFEDSSLEVMLQDVYINNRCDTGFSSYGPYHTKFDKSTIYFNPNYLQNPSRDVSEESAISLIYGFGWGDTNHSLPRFSPHLKLGPDKYFYGIQGAGKFDWIGSNTTDAEKYANSYQLVFLTDNSCRELELEFEVINEHPVIKWEFDFLGAANKSDVFGFTLDSQDESIFVDSPISGAGGVASGYYNNCSSTIHTVKIKNIPAKEGPTLFQLALQNIRFESRGEDYVPYEIYDKFTTAPDGDPEFSSETPDKWFDDFEECFWKQKYTTPMAHHLTPWFQKAQEAGWGDAHCRFKPINHGYKFTIYKQDLNGADQTLYYGSAVDHGMKGGLSINPTFGNVKIGDGYNTTNYIQYVYQGVTKCTTEQRTWKNPFLNYGGFGVVCAEDEIYDETGLGHSYTVWDQTVEFAPVSITLNSIRAIKNKKNYYHTIPILESLPDGVLKILDDYDTLEVNSQINHASRFDCGEDGDLNGTSIPYSYVWYKSGDEIKLKPNTGCLPAICGFSLSSGVVESGVLRVLTEGRTGVYFAFTDGWDYALTDYPIPTGSLVSFEEFYTPADELISGAYPLNRFEDYVVASVEDSSPYQVKFRVPNTTSLDAEKPNKEFSTNFYATGYFGNPLSNLKEDVTQLNIIHAIVSNTGAVEIDGVLPQTFPTVDLRHSYVEARSSTTSVGACPI